MQDREWTYTDRGSKSLGYDLVGPVPGIRGAFEEEDEVRLASAAPNLLAALEWYVEHDDSEPEGFYAEGKKRAEAAIAKAKGQILKG